MNKKFFKELFIVVLLVLVIVFILFLLFYDVLPTNEDKLVSKEYERNAKTEGVLKEISETTANDANTTADGSLEFRGLDVDPRTFTNQAGKPFDMFKPVPGVDLIQVTKDFFAEDYDPDTATGATYVEIQSNGSFKAVASPTSSFGGLQFKIFAKEPIIIANGAIGGEAVDAWILECTNN